MELRHLQYFKILAQELHFGNAAKKLFISQPPLSRQIKELEMELGVDLFLRNNKKVELTEAGKYFYKQVDRIIDELNQVKNTTRLIHEELSGELSFGFISSTPKEFVVKILKNLKNDFPQLQINLIEASSQRQIEALSHGKLDLCIVRGNILREEIVKELLFNDELCIVGPKGSSSNISDIKKSDFISFNSDYAPEYYQLSIDLCKQLGFEPIVKHQCNNMNAILELVELGVGYVIAPLSIVVKRNLNIISSSSLKNKVESVVYLAYHQDNSRTELIKIVDSILKTIN